MTRTEDRGGGGIGHSSSLIQDQTKTTTMKSMTTNITVMKTITMKTTTIYSGAHDIFCG